MTAILDIFDDRTVRMRLDEVTAYSGLPRSTCYRILEQLVALGWLQHRPSGYALGPRAVRLGGLGDSAELRSAALPVLRELSAHTGATVHLGILNLGDIVYLDRVGGISPAAQAFPSRIGGRAPGYATALGKAVLAWSSPEEVDALYLDGMRPYTPNTIIELPTLHRELQRVRRRHGVAYAHGEYLPGTACVAVAVRGYDRAWGAVEVCGDDTAGAVDRLAPAVLDAARRVSARLDPDAATAITPESPSGGVLEQLLAMIDDDTLL
ncbi:IclR family transcriptional regulator [Nocardia sp. NPDC059091]